MDGERRSQLIAEIASLPLMSDYKRRQEIVNRLDERIRVQIGTSERAIDHVSSIVDTCYAYGGASELRHILRSFYGYHISDYGFSSRVYAAVVKGSFKSISKGLLSAACRNLERQSGSTVSVNTALIDNSERDAVKFSVIILVIECASSTFNKLTGCRIKASDINAWIEVRELYREEKWLIHILSAIASTGVQVWQRQGGTWFPVSPSLTPRTFSGMLQAVKDCYDRWTSYLHLIGQSISSWKKRSKDHVARPVVKPHNQPLWVRIRLYVIGLVILAAVMWLFLKDKQSKDKPPVKVVSSPSPHVISPSQKSKQALETIKASFSWDPSNDKAFVYLYSEKLRDIGPATVRCRITVRHNTNRHWQPYSKVAHVTFLDGVASFSLRNVQPITYSMVKVDGNPVEITVADLFDRKIPRRIVIDGRTLKIPSFAFDYDEDSRNSTRIIEVQNHRIQISSREIWREMYDVSLNVADVYGNIEKDIDVVIGKGSFSYPPK